MKNNLIDEIVCLECNEKVQSNPKTTLLGFTQYLCPICNKKNIYPLTKERYICYIFIIVIFFIYVAISIVSGISHNVIFGMTGLFILKSAVSGMIVIPTVLVVIAIISIRDDIKSRKNIENTIKKYNSAHLWKDRIELKL